MEVEMTRIAAYFGHSIVVGIFLNSSKNSFLSSVGDRCQSAILGAAEAGRCNDVMHLAVGRRDIFSRDPIKGHVMEMEPLDSFLSDLFKSSFAALCVSGNITGVYSEVLPVFFSSTNVATLSMKFFAPWGPC